MVILSFFPYYRGRLMMGGDILAAIFDTCHCVSGRTWNEATFCLPNEGFEF